MHHIKKHANLLLGFLLGAGYITLETLGLFDAEKDMSIMIGATFVMGLISAIPSPAKWWKGMLGVYIGQWTLIFTIGEPGNIWPIAMVFQAGFAAIFGLPGGAVVFGIWKLKNRKGKEPAKANIT